MTAREFRTAAHYWLGWPLRWLYQMAHNGHGIVRVLDITKFRPMKSGLVGPQHPWVTGINPATGKPIWHENVVFRTPRPESDSDLASDDVVIEATGRFLATRVRQSSTEQEIPLGPKRRMPHGINYIHGTSHYNSGFLVFTNFQECYRHITDPAFRRELYRFVKEERREVLFLFRNRDYHPREYAYFSCCMRVVFPWFCNPNGPQQKILWGNAAPFPAANLITGQWIRDVYALKRLGGAEEVVRPPIEKQHYFQGGPYDQGRDHPLWPERLLARMTYLRVRIRGEKAGMYFVDRRQVYADQIANLASRGQVDRPLANW